MTLVQTQHTVEIPGFATYQHQPGLPKPAIHPLRTPSGLVISGFEMSDHIWHRGLWFTFKFLNGDNFWEEGPDTGAQETLGIPRATIVSGQQIRVEQQLHWKNKRGHPVIRERRVLNFIRHGGTIWQIDWSTDLQASEKLLIDRTPYTTWGGYGGLAFRASRELHEACFLLPDGTQVEKLAGERHPWTIMQGRLDGGAARFVSIGFVDHPRNYRAPTPWYNKSGGGFSFVNAAIVFHEPISLEAQERLSLRYAVFVRDGLWQPGEFAAIAEEFSKKSEQTDG
ncbi:MAG: PmoA family protein [Phycisphaerae bacterium]|nr:PmoA family protein [Phycisphaerae bacterium]